MYKTERIQFQPLQSEYISDLEKMLCENHIVMKSAFKGRVFTKEEFKELIKNEFILSKNDILGFRCITSISENKLIGISGLHKFKYFDKEYYEFGFILHENYWGKGLATEIGNFWTNYSKNEIGLTELFATVSPKNLVSKRVLEKLNMKPFATSNFEGRGDRLILRKEL
ncbi:GNAT family N-acetyltransferase [Cellulophaga baltica]|uniref:GNAT family N-acetyltransferase n=1 Tax=Cellulophaga TaxID=104264 RepID=UPI001C06934F|nr:MULTISPECIES: GNAT family N-acetyltransferase [Cellulophaga]MBU2994892.1 GNAT family N-acetyltransferase [Cellulophaga baltica]MDO6766286.1 GNAT family N-acetyltransferase [Cellulophaga sp. 1_MG-2023]